MRNINALLFVLALFCLSAFAQQSGVPDARFNRLRHGINLSHWFSQSNNYDPQRLATYMTAWDFDLIKSMGFDHVRLTFEPALLFNPGQPDRLNSKYLPLLDDAVATATQRGLAVILDMHPSGDFKQKLAREEKQVEGFTDFWRSLAAHFAQSDPDRVFFEILNEPEIADGYRWYGIQTRVVAAVRSVASHHTIIVTGGGWGNLEDLVAMQPLADSNLVYNFHYYYPHMFTHQGATWGEELWHHLPRVHYPSRPSADADLIAALPEFSQKVDIVRYDQDRWSHERIEADIAQVAAWATVNHVRVTCNEFGVFREHAHPGERAAWLNDVRTSLESHGMGWTMWDYTGGFNVATGEPGGRVPDERVLKALGLK